MKRTDLQQNALSIDAISYSGFRFPPDVISYAMGLYYRFPLSLRMVEELLAACGVELTYETVRRWSVKFGMDIARRIRSAAVARGDKWHLYEIVQLVASFGADFIESVRSSLRRKLTSGTAR